MGTITDKLNKLAETKSAIKTAIVNKGVSISDTDTFASYADKISSISGGGSTPTEGIYGVFIYDTHGNLTKPEEWDTANNDLAVGVAVIDENCSFVIGKTQNTKGIVWSSKLYEKSIEIELSPDKNLILYSYAGESNSSIVRGLTSGETNAFNWAYGNTITVNGTTLYGYIGSGGEWQTAYDNKAAINSALSKIGGTAMDTSFSYLTSTQQSINYAWGLDWFNGDNNQTSKNEKFYYSRAFYHLDNPNKGIIINNKRKQILVDGNVTLSGTLNLDSAKNPSIVLLDGNSNISFDNVNLTTNSTNLSGLIRFISGNVNKLPVGTITVNAPKLESISNIVYCNNYESDNYNLISYGLKIIVNSDGSLTDVSYMFRYLKGSVDIEFNNIGNITNCSYFYYNNQYVYKFNMPFDSSYCTNFNSMLYNCIYLIKFDNVSLKSLNSTISYSYFTGYSQMGQLRYVLLKDFGTGSKCTSASFKYWPKWGIEDESIPLSAGARQSLIDTFITYSYDRATAGYYACSVKLHANTKALLTQDEIAQMTAKGYTLA